MNLLTTVINRVLTPFKRDRAIYLLCGLVLICYSIGSLIIGRTISFNLFIYSKLFFNGLAMSAVGYSFFYFFYLIAKLEKRPLLAYYKKFIILLNNSHEVPNLIGLTLAISVVLSVYTSWKMLIPTLVPYYLDPYLANLDSWLHLGHTPWVVIHNLFSSPWATASFNFLYNFWFCILWIFLITTMLLTQQPKLRERILISFCLVWLINGGLFATLLSSVGPAFYHLQYPGNELYQPLMSLLKIQHQFLEAHDSLVTLWALPTQDALWEAYTANHTTLGSGISAMPSMHITIASLIAMSLFHYNRKLGIIGWCYVTIIEIGSVNLAWHYAVDGYAALLLTTLIWHAVGYWQRSYSNHLSYNTHKVSEEINHG
jgi:hypothetical protein